MSARIGLLPLHRSRGLVVLADVAHELSLQIEDGGEDAAGDHVALDLAEPQLHLVEPGGVGRSEVQMHVRSEEHTSELQSQSNLVCRLLLEKKKETASAEVPNGHAGEDLPLRGGVRPLAIRMLS